MATYTLARSLPAGTDLRWLTFAEPTPGHTRPGQFVAATIGERQGYFAIASDPGDPLELLIKAEGDPAAAIAGLPEGATLEGSEAMGAGFPLERGADRPLVCLINGSAMSAARPVIRAELDRGLPRPVHLILGVLSPLHIPFGREMRLWAEAGVDVTIVVDQPADEWTGPVGYVQAIAQQKGLIRDDVTVLLCGVPPMQEAVLELYTKAGLDPELILMNY